MRRRTPPGVALLVTLALGTVTRVVAAPPSPPETSRAVEPANDPPYDGTQRRDPFRAPRANAAGGLALDTPRTPLQRYELGQLRLVAIIYNTKEPRAVVEDDQGLGYIIKVGTPIGMSGGQVQSIERGRVLVQDDSVDFYGEHHPITVALELRTAERGKE
jgi:type IV pilus assembly protein PilP